MTREILFWGLSLGEWQFWIASVFTALVVACGFWCRRSFHWRARADEWMGKAIQAEHAEFLLKRALTSAIADRDRFARRALDAERQRDERFIEYQEDVAYARELAEWKRGIDPRIANASPEVIDRIWDHLRNGFPDELAEAK